LAVATAGAIDVALDPTRTHVPLCPFHALTGLLCPLCGSLRAVDEFLRGNAAAATRDNVLLVLAVPVAIGVWLAWVARRRKRLGPPPSPRSARVVLAIVLALFTIVRNLPIAAALRPA
jgi:hypothetical protein